MYRHRHEDGRVQSVGPQSVFSSNETASVLNKLAFSEPRGLGHSKVRATLRFQDSFYGRASGVSAEGVTIDYKSISNCQEECDKHVSHISKLVRDIAPLVDGVKKSIIFFSCTVKGKSSLANFCHEPEIVRIARDFNQVVLCD